MRSDFYQLMSDLMQIERFDLKSNKDLEPIKSLQIMVDPFVPRDPLVPPGATGAVSLATSSRLEFRATFCKKESRGNALKCLFEKISI